MPGNWRRSASMKSEKYSCTSQNPSDAGSHVSTTRSRHPRALGEPTGTIRPVVQGENGHRGVERLVRERQRLGATSHRGAALGGRWASMTADGSRATAPVRRLVGAGAGADVQHRACHRAPPTAGRRCAGRIGAAARSLARSCRRQGQWTWDGFLRVEPLPVRSRGSASVLAALCALVWELLEPCSMRRRGARVPRTTRLQVIILPR